MLNFLKRCFAEQDGSPSGSTIFVFVLVACTGAGAWVYPIAVGVGLIGLLMVIASAERTWEVAPLISAHHLNILGYSWMIGLMSTSFFAFDYRSAFFMAFAALVIPPVALGIRIVASANKSS